MDNICICAYVFTCVYIYVHTYVCMYVRMYVCMYVCMYVGLCRIPSLKLIAQLEQVSESENLGFRSWALTFSRFGTVVSKGPLLGSGRHNSPKRGVQWPFEFFQSPDDPYPTTFFYKKSTDWDTKTEQLLLETSNGGCMHIVPLK